MLARDIMTRDVCVVSPDASVPHIAKLLVQRQISAVPVVEADGRIVGIVSEGDLIRRPEIGTERRRAWWLEMMSSREELAAEFVKANGLSARDVMTAEVITVGEDATVGEIASVLEKRRIKRVPVARAGRVVGVVSRSNLLQGLAALAGRVPIRVGGGDRELREAIHERLENQPWSRPISINVVVTDSVAHLWGVVDSEDERIAVRVLAERTPGVSRVEDHLTVLKVIAYAV